MDEDIPEELSMEATKYLQILFPLMMNSVKFKGKEDPQI